jgi:hypothetical protein
MGREWLLFVLPIFIVRLSCIHIYKIMNADGMCFLAVVISSKYISMAIYRLCKKCVTCVFSLPVN